jgi:hypothetical protein
VVVILLVGMKYIGKLFIIGDFVSKFLAYNFVLLAKALGA